VLLNVQDRKYRVDQKAVLNKAKNLDLDLKQAIGFSNFLREREQPYYRVLQKRIPKQ
jgi:hypothetical protein